MSWFHARSAAARWLVGEFGVAAILCVSVATAQTLRSANDPFDPEPRNRLNNDLNSKALIDPFGNNVPPGGESPLKANTSEKRPAPFRKAKTAETSERGKLTCGDNEKKIRAALDSKTELEFVDTPLSDVVDYLKDFHEIEIQIDNKALDDVGIGTDEPVNVRLKGVTLRSALDLILGQRKLSHLITDDVLLITSSDYAESVFVVKVYPVNDLVGTPATDDTVLRDLDDLATTIAGTIAPDSWDCRGCGGSIRGGLFGHGRVLVVRQTDQVHEAIAQLLANIRKLAPTPPQQQQPATEQPTKPALKPLPEPKEGEAAIRRALEECTELEFIETPLTDMVDYLKERHRIEIQLDTRALNDVGMNNDTPITKNLRRIRLRSALNLLLRELELTYTITNEVLLITTPHIPESPVTVKVYPVAISLPSATDKVRPGRISILCSTQSPSPMRPILGHGRRRANPTRFRPATSVGPKCLSYGKPTQATMP